MLRLKTVVLIGQDYYLATPLMPPSSAFKQISLSRNDIVIYKMIPVGPDIKNNDVGVFKVIVVLSGTFYKI